jgi:hypothetical protein
MSPTNPNGSSLPSASELLETLQTTKLEADLAQLTTLLSQETLSSDDDANVIELLQRLESADGMAQGVENKLDDILEKLDGLINSLESKGDDIGGQLPTEKTDEPLTEKTFVQST